MVGIKPVSWDVIAEKERWLSSEDSAIVAFNTNQQLWRSLPELTPKLSFASLHKQMNRLHHQNEGAVKNCGIARTPFTEYFTK